MENEKITIVALVFSGIVAISTIVYSYLTNRLVKETKLSREFHLEAHMIAYLVNSETAPDLVSLIVKNIGNGIAKNLRFKVIRDINYPNCNRLSDIGIFNKELDFFPPNYENKYFLLSLSENYEEKSRDFIEIEVTYDDAIMNNKQYFLKLEFKDIMGIGKLTPPETYVGMISYRLEKIEKILEKKMK